MDASSRPLAAEVALTAGREAAEDRGAAERHLVERHRWGDEEAFAEVFRSHQSMVYNVAYRLAGDREEARDLAQEVFLRVFRHLGRFRGGSSLKTWIYRITVNQCRSRLSRRRPPVVGFERRQGGSPLEVADTARTPEERALGRDDQRRLGAAIARVPEPFRSALVLRDVEGLSYRQIGEVTGASQGTVRSRIARGRQHLRRLLEGEPW
ncbi:MAG TPA: sigma-70 family RNA polymerase sigma factor [Thermoanaerobaculia bacterium]|nr:sigma-70 family RNA polymerase sigma factor [Thermoanaerobaculia bacterium]